MTKAVSSLGELGESVLLAGELRGSITPTVLVSRRIYASVEGNFQCRRRKLERGARFEATATMSMKVRSTFETTRSPRKN